MADYLVLPFLKFKAVPRRLIRCTSGSNKHHRAVCKYLDDFGSVLLHIGFKME